ncbi:hypothetical protein L873DRAFT_652802 [Choiromyces venosus 120613-1]|uniref:Uncharacterized protein n=1 Tax=Choiromyces venosus 120613-1 TaxID=1336337 RepID=A0A3N4IWW9_9PEZI|nr:hypothetical protein L873DRAFT_652802 [Choiromyces venosus 120613-1]
MRTVCTSLLLFLPTQMRLVRKLILLDEDLQFPFSQHVKVYSALSSVVTVKPEAISTTLAWSEYNEVDEIWKKIVKQKEEFTGNPRYHGWTTDEIIDSLFINEDHMPWEAAREENETHDKHQKQREEREEWRFEFRNSNSIDSTTLISRETGPDPGIAVVELTWLGQAKTMFKPSTEMMPKRKLTAAQVRRPGWDEDGGD